MYRIKSNLINLALTTLHRGAIGLRRFDHGAPYRGAVVEALRTPPSRCRLPAVLLRISCPSRGAVVLLRFDCPARGRRPMALQQAPRIVVAQQGRCGDNSRSLGQWQRFGGPVKASCDNSAVQDSRRAAAGQRRRGVDSRSTKQTQAMWC